MRLGQQTPVQSNPFNQLDKACRLPIPMPTPSLSFVIPCLNESRTIAEAVRDCHIGAQQCNLSYEIIVADNGSSDGSQTLAAAQGAKVISVEKRGYGAALQAGIDACSGDYIIMGDADQTYDFCQAPAFIHKLKEGYDLVMGNRFQGKISQGAMPVLHYYLGNPVLSLLGKIFFGIKIGDFHCGLRAFRRKAIENLNLRCQGMEFASEMVIKSSLMNLLITEIPTDLRPDPPGRKPHLKTWRDGWRHLKFMLSFAPRYNLLPLSALFAITSAIFFLLYQIQAKPFTGANTLIFAAASIVISANIASDYILTQEMIYSEFDNQQQPLAKRRPSRQLLGLNKGTDRIFKLALLSLTLSAVSLIGLSELAAKGLLSSSKAGSLGFLSCSFLIISTTLYQTGSKITSFRSLKSQQQANTSN